MVKKMGQKFRSYAESVFYTHIRDVINCIKSISELDDVSYASFCSLSNLAPF